MKLSTEQQNRYDYLINKERETGTRYLTTEELEELIELNEHIRAINTEDYGKGLPDWW